MSPASKGIAVFLDDASSDIVLSEDHGAAGFVLGKKGDGAAGNFYGEVRKCVFGNIKACLLNFHVGSVKVVFNDGSDICLDEECVFAQFFKLVSFVLEVQAILILRV